MSVVGQDNRLLKIAKSLGSKESVLVAAAVVLTLLSSWGYYLKLQEVSGLHSSLAIAEAHIEAKTSALRELNDVLAEVETQMALNEEQYSTITSALRQEISALKERLSLPGPSGAVTPAPSSTAKTAYLTFDDGPLTATSQILDVLKEHDVRATFFVNGRSNGYSLGMYKRMVAEGHAIGNHTYSHEYDKVYSSVSGFVSEVEQLQKLVFEATGIVPEIFRFPAGSDNRVSFGYSGKDLMPTLTRVVNAMGMQYFDWNVTSGSASSAATTESIYASVIDGCQGKSVVNILFHETSAVAEALPLIIEELMLQGYSFAPLTVSSPAMQFLR